MAKLPACFYSLQRSIGKTKAIYLYPLKFKTGLRLFLLVFTILLVLLRIRGYLDFEHEVSLSILDNLSKIGVWSPEWHTLVKSILPKLPSVEQKYISTSDFSSYMKKRNLRSRATLVFVNDNVTWKNMFSQLQSSLTPESNLIGISNKGSTCSDCYEVLATDNRALPMGSPKYNNMVTQKHCIIAEILPLLEEAVIFDADIACQNNTSVWDLWDRKNIELGSYCSEKSNYNGGMLYIKSTDQTRRQWMDMCRLATWSNSRLRESYLLSGVLGCTMVEQQCSTKIGSKFVISPDYATCIHASGFKDPVEKQIFLQDFVDAQQNKLALQEIFQTIEKDKSLIQSHKKILRTMRPFYNEIQKALVLFLRMTYDIKLFPMDVKTPALTHTTSRYGTSRGTSIGRYYIHEFMNDIVSVTAKTMKWGSHLKCLEIGDGHFIKNNLFAICDVASALSMDLNDKRASIRGNIESPFIGTGLELASFDLIVCCQVLEHVDHPALAMKGLYDMIKPGGAVIITVPSMVGSPIHGAPHDTYRYTKHGLTILAQDAGFNINVMKTRGNALTSIAYQLELSAEDLSAEELNRQDDSQYAFVLALLLRPNSSTNH